MLNPRNLNKTAIGKSNVGECLIFEKSEACLILET
jgi:hypothetical protein